MSEQAPRLPAALLLGQPEVPVDEVQMALGGVDDDKLGAAVLALVEAERKLVLLDQRPARQDQVAIASFAVGMVELVEGDVGLQAFGEDLGLIVEAGALDVVIDFLQADQ